MKKGLLIMLCLSLLAFAPACHRKNGKPAHTKTTKVKTKKMYKSGKAKVKGNGSRKKVVVEETK